jgi:urease accessory protein
MAHASPGVVNLDESSMNLDDKSGGLASTMIAETFQPLPPWALAPALAAMPSPALAHSANGMTIDFWGGFAHPLFGPDHVIAMVAVGLWGAFLGAPAIWLLPVVFPLVMAFGGALGVVGMPLPGVETGIAVSAIMLGAMVALAARPPLWIAAALVGAFAIFHGHAHGAELPIGADAVAYSIGFVIATGMLHLTGIAFGTLSHWPAGRLVVRTVGGIIALIGVAYLRGLL